MLEQKVAESVSLIKGWSKLSEPPLVVMFSGGQDSMAVALLCKIAGVNAELLFMESSIDLPGSAEFAESRAESLSMKLHKSNPSRDYFGDFSFWVRKFGYFPTVNNAYCSGRLKLRPTRVYLRGLYGKQTLYKLTGVRRAESSRRKRIYSKGSYLVKDQEHAGSYMGNPILDWLDGEVLAFLGDSEMLTESPLYKKVGVSGCFWCPFYQQSIVERIARAYPGIYQGVIALEAELGKPSCPDRKYLRHIVYRAENQLKLNI